MILRQANRCRAGWTLIFVLVVLAVLTSFMALAAQNAAAARRLLNHRADQLQSQWLALAGLELAEAQLLSNPMYQGGQSELISDCQLVIKVDAGGTDGMVKITSTATCSKLGLAPARVELNRTIRKQ